ncbi:MAG: phosphoglycerate kinase [Proteobacteria bacterium]|nr:phosphoglycerate kinase [Pseudomonadota bacterium]
MSDLDLKNKRVIIREDFNVPIANGKITNDARIKAALPTIELALKNGAAVILLSHLGRPTEGTIDSELSLSAVADALSKCLNKPVRFISDWLNGFDIQPGEIVLCENTRFNVGEKKDDALLSQKIAALGDIFVMDAFGAAHRAEASTHGVVQYAKVACAGPLLMTELNALGKAMDNPEHPLLAIVGGSKVSTKLGVLENLVNKVDCLITGGGIANTFLAAAGFPIGKSLYEKEFIATAQQLLKTAKERNVQIPLPVDVVVSKEFSVTAKATVKGIHDVSDDDLILDIGPTTATQFSHFIQSAKTIVWNGPVGVFEIPQFSEGTKAIGEAIAHSKAFSLAGGGDTLAAIDQFHLHDKISYLSTGGGASLEYIEGKVLPAVAILEKHAS